MMKWLSKEVDFEFLVEDKGKPTILKSSKLKVCYTVRNFVHLHLWDHVVDTGCKTTKQDPINVMG